VAVDAAWEAQSPGGSCGQLLELLVLLKVTRRKVPWKRCKELAPDTGKKKITMAPAGVPTTTSFHSLS